MTDHGMSDQHPDDYARRYDTARGWLVESASLAVGVAAIDRYAPDGFVANAIIFIGAYVLAHFFASVAVLACDTALGLVTVVVFLFTFGHAFTTLPLLPAVLLSLFLPGIAQAYVIWDLWPATSHLLHPFTLCCMIWLALLAICVLEPGRFRRLKVAVAARRRRA